MKRFAFLVLGLASAAVADEQFYGVPLRTEGECQVRNNHTNYVVEIRNVTNQPVENIRITRAGVGIQNIRYNPPLMIKRIPAKGSYTLRFTVRGTIAPLPDYREFGIEAEYYFQRNKHQSAFPGPPCFKRPR